MANFARVRILGIDKLRKKLRPETVGPALRRFHQRVDILIQNAARRLAPVWRGRLRNSITYEIDSSPVPAWSRVGTNVPYAPRMEFGTGDHFDGPPQFAEQARPPVTQSLNRWAKSKGFASGKAVSRIIERQGGLTPRRYLRGAVDETRPRLPSEVNRLAVDIDRRLDG